MDKQKIKAFWDVCSPGFSHIERDYKQLTSEWDSFFINHLNSFVNISGKVVLDYGIGAAYLGQHLHKKFGLKKYIGVDISERQLNAAKINLDQNNVPNSLHLVPQIFESFGADIFISQAVIQHFPDKEYLDSFLSNINNSNIPFICLQHRYSPETFFKDGDYNTEREVCRRCNTHTSTILEGLSKYKTLWVSDIKPTTNYQFMILKR